jgi:iron complex outermembrane receptor protein
MAAWVAASVLGCLLACGTGAASAQALSLTGASDEVNLPATTVTATRTAQSVADVPASVDVVSGARIRESGPLLNLSESLARVPGLGVLNRQNLAQDLQITSRGFGARR